MKATRQAVLFLALSCLLPACGGPPPVRHLHFQLQDGKDFLTANGLPVIFGNARTRDSAFGIEANAYWGTTIVPLMVK